MRRHGSTRRSLTAPASPTPRWPTASITSGGCVRILLRPDQHDDFSPRQQHWGFRFRQLLQPDQCLFQWQRCQRCMVECGPECPPTLYYLPGINSWSFLGPVYTSCCAIHSSKPATQALSYMARNRHLLAGETLVMRRPLGGRGFGKSTNICQAF